MRSHAVLVAIGVNMDGRRKFKGAGARQSGVPYQLAGLSGLSEGAGAPGWSWWSPMPTRA